MRDAAGDEVAGILVESIQGEGGYIVTPPGFFPALRELLKKRFPTARILPFTEFPQGPQVGGIDDDKTAELLAGKGCRAVIIGNAG